MDDALVSFIVLYMVIARIQTLTKYWHIIELSVSSTTQRDMEDSDEEEEDGGEEEERPESDVELEEEEDAKVTTSQASEDVTDETEFSIDY